jgi:molybdopterin/thiamine biosynthesis adenylyltransferase
VTDEPPFDEAADPELLQRFIDEIEAAGFERVEPSSWEGPTPRSLIDAGHTDSERMTIIIQPAWPYFPPLLRVPGIAAWHADRERLCIWHGEDFSQRWKTLQGIYDRIDEWIEEAKDGFAAVENARNPEIYWQEDIHRVAGLVDVDALIGDSPTDGDHGEFHFGDARSADGQVSPINVFDIERGAFRITSPLPMGLDNHRLARGRWFYRSSVPHPPRSIEELRSFLTDKQRDRLDRDLRARPVIMYGLVWPNNAGLVATMILSIADQTGARTDHLVVLRPKGRIALLLRAGPDAAVLQQRSVAILGVGAIGSHIAELLTRAGIGRLLLVDFDLLWPVNLVRHAAPPGTPARTTKTDAMRDYLGQYPWVQVDVVEGALGTPSGLRQLLASADMTIDATGHAGLAELIGRVARGNGRPVASAALFRGGAVARVRRQALDRDTPFLQRPHLDRYPEIPPLDDELEYVGTETGCLALVHNAPPTAVTLAATVAAEVAIDHLTGRHDHPDEIIEVIRAGEPPFDQLGRLRPDDLPVTIDLTEHAQDQLRQLGRAALPVETGGILLGCHVDGRPVVTGAIEIPDTDATETRYRIPEGATQAAVAAARERDARIGYLGEWHSHPSGKGPSPLDVAAMLALDADADDDTTDPILVLVEPSSNGQGRLDAFVTRNGRVTPASICSTGDLPGPEKRGHVTTFISYSGDRQQRVELVHALRDYGVTPWRDVENLDAGDPTTDTIEAELSECSSVILWINETVLASAYVADVELPAIARAARDRAIRITPVFDGLTPSEAAERISRFGIEIGDNNGHVVDASLAHADTAAAIALAHATGEVRAAHRSGRPPIVRLVTYDDTAAHRDDAVLNLDWRHHFTSPTLDRSSEDRLRDALVKMTAAMKAIYGATEITLAVKAHLPIAVALGHAFAEPTGCTIRMTRADVTYTVRRAGTDATPLREAPYSKGPIDVRAAAVEVAVTRDTEAGVNGYVGAGNRYRERILLVPPDGPGRFALDGSETCNAWARQVSEVVARLAARPDIDRVDLFVACPVELAVAIGWWANAIGPLQLVNWTGKAGPYAPMWRLP